MKELFSMYYTPDEEAFKELWDESIFVFDANVLLNLYRYTINTKNTFLNVIESLSDRIFIPHQVALEFHSNRVKVILEQAEAYSTVKKTLKSVGETVNSKIIKELNGYSQKHPIIDINSIQSKVSDTIKLLVNDLEVQEKEHPDYLIKDKIRIFLDKHIKSIGNPYTQSQLDDIFKEGEKRYGQKRPPGYEDAERKKGERKYHQGLIIESQFADFVVWKQVIEESKNKKKPVIFVTDDQKEDWWKRELGKTVGPRVELIDEFLYHTNEKFHMYGSHQFLEFAQKYLKQLVNQDAVKEVRELFMFDDSTSEKNKFIDSNYILVQRKDGSRHYRRKQENSGRWKREIEYLTGERVYHQKYGEGTVVISSLDEVTIVFSPSIGVKRFNTKMAPIKKIHEISE